MKFLVQMRMTMKDQGRAMAQIENRLEISSAPRSKFPNWSDATWKLLSDAGNPARARSTKSATMSRTFTPVPKGS
eukprot:12071179-Heterocapsa_arctica.AAC.1